MKAVEVKKKLEQRYAKQNEFNKDNYDRVSVMFPKDYRDVVREEAKRQGMSLNAFILAAVKEKMSKSELDFSAYNQKQNLEEMQKMIDKKRKEIELSKKIE